MKKIRGSVSIVIVIALLAFAGVALAANQIWPHLLQERLEEIDEAFWA